MNYTNGLGEIEMRCKVPGCKNEKTTTWALVPVCSEHHQQIEREVKKHYARKITRPEQVTLGMIYHLTPWSKKWRWM